MSSLHRQTATAAAAKLDAERRRQAEEVLVHHRRTSLVTSDLKMRQLTAQHTRAIADVLHAAETSRTQQAAQLKERHRAEVAALREQHDQKSRVASERQTAQMAAKHDAHVAALRTHHRRMGRVAGSLQTRRQPPRSHAVTQTDGSTAEEVPAPAVAGAVAATAAEEAEADDARHAMLAREVQAAQKRLEKELKREVALLAAAQVDHASAVKDLRKRQRKVGFARFRPLHLCASALWHAGIVIGSQGRRGAGAAGRASQLVCASHA